ncbi:MAG TPA: aminodeoxychorismate/anthranilate synthase component II [Flavobacteriales bacterium]|nr:aminodeoxychorismate/anthranilate synthase component II [Flavobacteriales bacterium]
MPRILIIDCFDSFTYNIFHYLDELNSGHCDVVRYDKLDVRTLSEYTHLVISPGPGLPDEYPNIKTALSALDPGMPVLGVCLGLQCIVQFYGGTLERLDSVKHGVESQLHFQSESVLFQGIKEPMKIGHYHSWIASDRNFPDDVLRVTSRNDEGFIMSLQHRSLPLFAVQFHPESVMTENGKRLIKNWLLKAKSS